jgi:hypothetical protein
MRHALFACLLIGVLVPGAAGCAANAPNAASPAPRAAPILEPEPTTVEEAQAQLERARATIGGAPADRAPSAPPPPPSATTTSEAPGPQPTSPGAGPSADSGQASAGPCVEACRAIASMRRAVGVICRLAGEDDARCVDAKKSLGDSEGRVSKCGC